jgi:DNA-binding beta-propeller fold protein YncE
VTLEGYLNAPKAVFSDGTKFFVADTGNNRLLIWNMIPVKKDQEFDVVLGQSNTTDVLPNKGDTEPNYNTMNAPAGVYSDGTSLYVADTGNNRILLFKQTPTMNGWHADEVIGQERFKNAKPNHEGKVSDSSFNSPQTISINDGKLYVCDAGNNRVLFFNVEKGLGSAEGIIGQATFRASGINPPAGIPNSYTLFAPTSIFIKDGILYITDKGNNRALVY